MATWHVTDNKLTHDDLPEPLTGNYIQPPYPPFWWYANDGNLTHDGLPEPISAIMSEPYPPFWWYVENGRLTHAGLPEPLIDGAFSGTALKRVRIASDCSYSKSSFPDGCAVEFYDQEQTVPSNMELYRMIQELQEVNK